MFYMQPKTLPLYSRRDKKKEQTALLKKLIVTRAVASCTTKYSNITL